MSTYRRRPRAALPDGLRWCVGCQQPRREDEFPPYNRSWCYPCRQATNRAHRVENREAYNAAQRARARALYVGRPPRSGTCARPGCLATFTTVQPAKRYCSPGCGSRARTERPGRPNWLTRRRILNRDNWTCYLDGEPIPRDLAWPHPRSASVDHVIPVSAGGSDADENLRATHWGCNEAKGDSLPGVEIWVPLEVAV